ncbi:hypothetical protein D0863_15196 [Hortaea werneckii]|uniref:Septation initiation network scaffold protein cdc11 n=1 Tax=Hortaea werneckii TaxID=91943 RepID=A0A3M7CB85_HORWE|nr:hypothetical protein D0863_15196 [Hortaea werneckii]
MTSGSVAPWLEGLGDTWEIPAPPAAPQQISSASHDASSLRSNSSTKLQRQTTVNSNPSSLGAASNATTQIKRSPLAPLSNSNANTMHRLSQSQRQKYTRSISDTSNNSMLQCGTVQQRPKSASPTKQETLEWKRRLLNGSVGYGDQTELFGATGLENIFAPTKSKSTEHDVSKRRSRMQSLLQRHNSDAPMPSSPPPWPSEFRDFSEESISHDHLEPVGEEQEDEAYEGGKDEQDEDGDRAEEEDEEQEDVDGPEDDGSFRSNPFDLHFTSDANEDQQGGYSHDETDGQIEDSGLQQDYEDNNDSFDTDPYERHQAAERQEDLQKPMEQGDEAKGQAKVANRAISGQTDATRFSQEEFSPVFISKQTMQNGKIDYAAFDSNLMKEYNSMKVKLQQPSGEQERDAEIDQSEELPQADGPLPTAADLSLSENLPTGTPPPQSFGLNTQLRREGYSRQGSHQHRPLTPSPAKNELSPGPDDSALLSPFRAQARPLPNRPDSPVAPSTPLRPQTPDPPKSRSSGSPLKLFGPHDTFTNKRLLRRMSQLDPEGIPVIEESEQGSMREPSQARRVFSEASQNSFGSGELDKHAFNAEITITSASDSDKIDQSQGSPGSEVPVPGGKDPLNFKLEVTPDVRSTFKLKRKLSRQSAARSSKSSTLEHPKAKDMSVYVTAQDASQEASEMNAYFERANRLENFDGGKRPPTSPFKNPTPKRRRTLHTSELEEGLAEVNHSYHSQIEAAGSGKRSNNRSDQAQKKANASILASRRMLRPRNPTPSQRRRSQLEAEIREAAEDFAQQEPERLEALHEQIESSMAGSEGALTLEMQAQAVAKEIANFTLRVHKPSGEHSPSGLQGARQPSLTTQDFWDEANFVMQLIRQRANRPHSGLSSVEESEAEGVSMGNGRQDESMLSGSSNALRVSRPPSREGGHSGWRSGKTSQNTDAQVIDHLKRYEERDETEFIADSTLDMEAVEDSAHENVITSDEPHNIRVTGPSPLLEDEASDESRPVSQRSQGSTFLTQQSAGMSTGRTFGSTTSTRKSDNVGTLAPDAVAHLIGGQVGGMVFDREKQQWVRARLPHKKTKTGFLEPPSQLTASDDDPLREISDLRVDERVEMRRLSGQADEPSAVAAAVNNSVPFQHKQSIANQETDANSRNSSTETVLTSRPAGQQSQAGSHASSTETAIPRPVTRDSSHMQSRIHHMHSSSVPSTKYTAFGSSQQQQEQPATRTTSWNTDELSRLSAMGKARQQPLAYAAAQATLALRGARNSVAEEPEPDNTVNGATEVTLPTIHSQYVSDQASGLPKSPSPLPPQSEARNVKEASAVPEEAYQNEEDDEVHPIESLKQGRTPSKPAFAPFPATERPGSMQSSLRRQMFANRFPTDAEHSEISFHAPLPGQRMMSLSLSVSKPLAGRHQSQMAPLQSSPTKPEAYETFLMSELNDFTISEEDEQRPSEQALAKRLARYEVETVNDRHALIRKDLVKTLTDVNAEEPYWEHIKRLDLHDHKLVSLHGLDEFHPRIQDLDISGNPITHMEGAPSTIRKLMARSCELSSLTNWGHLMNLQYLDISGNQLSDLHGMSNLIHLREIRADDNQISSLEGVLELDGLLKVRMRRNKIQQVDFEGCQLQQLTDLDLCGNEITSIAHLPALTALRSLKLDCNPLGDTLSMSQSMPLLRELSLKLCGLRHLDIFGIPKLRKLEVDDNCLSDVESISNCKSLELLSMRRQSLPEGDCISVFDRPLEARSVRLSGNNIPSLELSCNFLNIQHLELASAGLHDLPDDFGLRLPNLLTLNLNFNSLRDLRPLLNIHKLQTLRLAGNRLSRLRKTIAVLGKLQHITSLDLRDNPLTQSFYAPLTPTSTQQSLVLKNQLVPTTPNDEDAQAELFEQAQYNLPLCTDHNNNTDSAGRQRDETHQMRLDEETKLRRRVYELLIGHSCPYASEVDGLRFDRARAGKMKKDGTWERLVQLGIVRKSGIATTSGTGTGTGIAVGGGEEQLPEPTAEE